MIDLPQPMATVECNLRGFGWMPLDVSTLVDSEFFIHTTGDEFKAALALWCKSWMQVPAGSLPNNDVSLADLSRSKNWKKVKVGALRGWILCSDDRWYHPVIVAKALEALPSRKAHADNKAAANERKEREREDRKRLFALLREHGVVPDIHTKTADLRKLAEPYQSRSSSHDVTRDKSQAVTAKTGEDRTEQERTGQDRTGPSTSAPDGAGGGAADGLGELTVIDAGAAVHAESRDLTDSEEKLLWNAALALLIPSYSTGSEKGKDAKARTFIGGLGKRLKDAAVERRSLFDVIQECCVERPANPETWMSAAIAVRTGKRGKPGQLTDEQRQAANDASSAEALRLIAERTKPKGDVIDV